MSERKGLIRVQLYRGRGTVWVTKELVQVCRYWAEDCLWKEDPDEIKESSDENVVANVDRHYEGGIFQVAEHAFLDLPEVEHG